MTECDSVEQLIPTGVNTGERSLSEVSESKSDSTPHFRPELDLLLACMGTGEKSQRIRSLIRDSLDWAKFQHLTEHHRLIPQVCGKLWECDDTIPPHVLARFGSLYEANTRQTMRLTRDLVRVMTHFGARGISALPYKGPALAAMLRIDFTERQFSDIDLLVHPSDVQRSKAALAELGYTTKSDLTPRQEQSYIRSGYEYSFDLPDGKNVLELKWRILPHFYSVDFDVAAFFERSVMVAVAGSPMPSLCTEDLLLVLCAHAAKHAWSELSQLWDISRLLESASIEWDRVFNQANRLGLRRIVDMNLHLAHKLLGIRLQTGSGEAEIASALVTNRVLPIVLESRQVDNESVSYFRLMLRFRERFRDQMRFLWRLLSTPGLGEWSTVKLPTGLFSLYHAVRIYRLVLRMIGGAKRLVARPEFN